MSQDAPRADRAVKYVPDLCRQVVDYMGQGYSLTAFAGEIGVSRAKLDEWTLSHPLFAEAVARGRAARTRALEAGLLAAETGAKVSAHRLALRTVQSDDWRDRPEPERHVRPTAPIAGLDLPDNGRG